MYTELVPGLSPGTAGEVVGRTSCPIIIMQKPRNAVKHDLVANGSGKITSWCCIGRGEVRIKCTFEKDILAMDEGISMKYQIDNSKCKNTVKQVMVALQRKIILKMRDGMVNSEIQYLKKVPMLGCKPGVVMDEQTFRLDLEGIQDLGAPQELQGDMNEFSGKLQQN